MKSFLAFVALLLVASVAWRYIEASQVQGLAELEEQVRPALQFDHGALGGPPDAGGQARPAASKGIHKCKKGSVVTYTDAPCEHNRQEQALAGGTVTVVKGQRPATHAQAPAASASQALLRTLAGNPNAPSLRDQAIERAVNPP
jgi:hypothetical protein